MRYIFYIFIGSLIIFSACKNSNRTDEPENLIPRDQMVEVLRDMHLIEASIRLDNQKKLNKEEYTYFYYQYLFEKYGITEDDFDVSLSYYQSNIERFDTIYANVISELSRLQGETERK